MKKFRVYIENSVIGGYFDKEFKIPTRTLFDLFKKGVYIPVVSDHVFVELHNGAPKQVIDNLGTIDCEIQTVTDEMRELSIWYTGYQNAAGGNRIWQLKQKNLIVYNSKNHYRRQCGRKARLPI